MKPMHITNNPRFAGKVTVRTVLYSALFAALLVPAAVQAQLKIGDNPTQITPSAILELNSTQQGFLLPRLTTWAIDALTPPDGMMVYYQHSGGASHDSTGIYTRKNGQWQKVTTSELAQSLWSRKGNTITDGADTLGSLNAADLKIITDGTQRILIDGTSGRVRFTTDTVSATGRLDVGQDLTVGQNATVTGNAAIGGNATVTGALNVTDTAVINGSLYLNNVAANAPFSEVLVIDAATGVVARRTIDTTVFRGWTIGNFDETGIATGLERRLPTNGTDPDTLILHAATATMPGGVSVSTQEFGGNKTFVDSVAASKTLLVGATGTAAKATLQVEGSMAIKVTTAGGNYTIGDNDHTVLATANGITLTLPAPAASNAGRVYVVKKTNASNFTSSVKIAGHIENTPSAELDIYNQGTSYKFQSDGTSWWIIDRM